MQFYRFRGRQDTEAQRLRRGGDAHFRPPVAPIVRGRDRSFRGPKDGVQKARKQCNFRKMLDKQMGIDYNSANLFP